MHRRGDAGHSDEHKGRLKHTPSALTSAGAVWAGRPGWEARPSTGGSFNVRMQPRRSRLEQQLYQRSDGANDCKDSDRVCVWARASVGNVLGSGLGDAGGSSGAVDSGYGVADESLLRVLRHRESAERVYVTVRCPIRDGCPIDAIDMGPNGDAAAVTLHTRKN